MHNRLIISYDQATLYNRAYYRTTQIPFLGPQYSNCAIAAGAPPGPRWGSLQRSPYLLAGSAGLTIVPVLPWEGAPPSGAPRPNAIFTMLF